MSAAIKILLTEDSKFLRLATERALSRAGSSVTAAADGEEEPKKSFFASLGTAGIQRSIEAIASRKTENQLGKSKEGMMVVLERLRRGGLVGVLDGMRKDRELAFGREGVWKKG